MLGSWIWVDIPPNPTPPHLYVGTHACTHTYDNLAVSEHIIQSQCKLAHAEESKGSNGGYIKPPDKSQLGSENETLKEHRWFWATISYFETLMEYQLPKKYMKRVHPRLSKQVQIHGVVTSSQPLGCYTICIKDWFHLSANSYTLHLKVNLGYVKNTLNTNYYIYIVIQE